MKVAVKFSVFKKPRKIALILPSSEILLQRNLTSLFMHRLLVPLEAS
jgi:hypothetical protein